MTRLVLHCWYYWIEQAYCTWLSTGEWVWLAEAGVVCCCRHKFWIHIVKYFPWQCVTTQSRVCVRTCDCSACSLAYWKSFVDKIPQPANWTIKLILLQNMHFILISETCWLLLSQPESYERDWMETERNCLGVYMRWSCSWQLMAGGEEA